MTFLEALTIVKKETDGFVFWQSKIRKSLTDETIEGINAKASSSLRYTYTVERVKRVIDVNELPLRVIVGNPSYNMFKIIYFTNFKK